MDGKGTTDASDKKEDDVKQGESEEKEVDGNLNDDKMHVDNDNTDGKDGRVKPSEEQIDEDVKKNVDENASVDVEKDEQKTEDVRNHDSKANNNDEGKSCDDTVDKDKLQASDMAIVAAKIDGEVAKRAGPHISKEEFTRLVRVYYKVVREIVLSDQLVVEKSRQIRRMEVGEVMEVYQGPAIDPSVGVFRIYGRALRDGTVGWVTILGNQGMTFLVPGGNTLSVMRPTPLTDDLKDMDGSNVLCQLLPGQVLELLEWARTSRSALGVTRIRARVQGEGRVGWATTVGADGTVYLEVLSGLPQAVAAPTAAQVAGGISFNAAAGGVTRSW